MKVILSLSSGVLSDESIQRLTYDLCGSLRRELDGDATLGESPSAPGTKGGDPVTIGTIVLSLIGSGGVAVALINLFKSYIDRGQHLKISVTRPDGKIVEVVADNLGPAQLQETIKLIEELLTAS